MMNDQEKQEFAEVAESIVERARLALTMGALPTETFALTAQVICKWYGEMELGIVPDAELRGELVKLSVEVEMMLRNYVDWRTQAVWDHQTVCPDNPLNWN